MAGSLAKRTFDVVLAGVGLVVSAPLWGLIALVIKLDDGGAVLFRDLRVSRGCGEFVMLKFRTMLPEADRCFGPRQSRAGVLDPRVTRAGRWLRVTALDELPQLWNILRGDMSFVGPRPLRPAEIRARGDGQVLPLEAVQGYRERHAVRPGLTGLAQVHADRAAAPRHKFRYDRLYIRRHSFGLDLRLIARSLWITLRGQWDQRGRRH